MIRWLKDLCCEVGWHFRPKGADPEFIWLCANCKGLQGPDPVRRKP